MIAELQSFFTIEMSGDIWIKYNQLFYLVILFDAYLFGVILEDFYDIVIWPIGKKKGV